MNNLFIILFQNAIIYFYYYFFVNIKNIDFGIVFNINANIGEEEEEEIVKLVLNF